MALVLTTATVVASSVSSHDQQQGVLLFGAAVGLLTISIGYIVAFEATVTDYVVIALGIVLAWVAFYYFQDRLAEWE